VIGRKDILPDKSGIVVVVIVVAHDGKVSENSGEKGCGEADMLKKNERKVGNHVKETPSKEPPHGCAGFKRTIAI
jgi:hypothetical protein